MMAAKEVKVTEDVKDVKNVEDMKNDKDVKAAEDIKPDVAAPVKFFTRAEVAKHADITDTWIIIHNKVYNVTTFLNEHPGGEEVLLEQGGLDGTEAFEDIGHSSDARQMMEPFKIGELVEEERIKDAEKKDIDWSNPTSGEDSSSGSWRSWLIPIALGVLATLVYRYFTSAH